MHLFLATVIVDHFPFAIFAIELASYVRTLTLVATAQESEDLSPLSPGFFLEATL